MFTTPPPQLQVSPLQQVSKASFFFISGSGGPAVLHAIRSTKHNSQCRLFCFDHLVTTSLLKLILLFAISSRRIVIIIYICIVLYTLQNHPAPDRLTIRLFPIHPPELPSFSFPSHTMYTDKFFNTFIANRIQKILLVDFDTAFIVFICSVLQNGRP